MSIERTIRKIDQDRGGGGIPRVPSLVGDNSAVPSIKYYSEDFFSDVTYGEVNGSDKYLDVFIGPSAMRTELTVFDVLGQRVYRQSGERIGAWRYTNDRGARIARETYFAVVKCYDLDRIALSREKKWLRTALISRRHSRLFSPAKDTWYGACPKNMPAANGG